MKRKFNDDLVLARIVLSAVITAVIGMLVTRDVNKFMFEKLTWAFIVFSSILIIINVRMLYKMLDDSNDEENKEA